MTSTSRLDVLIVDDHDPQRRQLCGVLEDEGHTVTEAPGAAQALALVRDHAFDAIAMDVNMPGTDGLTAMLRIGELDPDVSVVIVTGEQVIQAAREAVLKLGAFDVIAKMPEPDHLIGVVEEAARITRHRRGRDAAAAARAEDGLGMVGQSAASPRRRAAC